MKSILCGGRDAPPFTPAETAWLDAFAVEHALSLVVEGGAPGVETYGRVWAQRRGIEVVTFWANGVAWGCEAERKRNRRMLDYLMLEGLSVGEAVSVIAFPGGSGTAQMCLLAERAHVQVLRRLAPVRTGEAK
jgi:hypothetical protein